MPVRTLQMALSCSGSAVPVTHCNTATGRNPSRTFVGSVLLLYHTPDPVHLISR